MSGSSSTTSTRSVFTGAIIGFAGDCNADEYAVRAALPAGTPKNMAPAVAGR